MKRISVYFVASPFGRNGKNNNRNIVKMGCMAVDTNTEIGF